MKKKLFIGWMLIVLSFAICGCKAEEDKNNSESTVTESPYDQDGDGYLDGWY